MARGEMSFMAGAAHLTPARKRASVRAKNAGGRTFGADARGTHQGAS